MRELGLIAGLILLFGMGLLGLNAAIAMAIR
jgi:hypothetical protein